MKQHIVVSWVVNDLRRNKVVNSALFLFLLIAALLMATGVLMIERLTGALDQMYEIAKPPHFLQMHVGEYDRGQIQAFADDTQLVETMQVQEMVNIEGVSISLTRDDRSYDTLSDSMLDNYFVTQNESFDFLLNLDNQVIQIAPGEVGVPVVYARQKQIQIGDILVIQGVNKKLSLRVTSLIRDAQMGSSLASSIRFLVHSNDFVHIQEEGFRQESIISFRLNSDKEINDFAGRYQSDAAQMPKNGIGITFPLIRLVNGIGDGLMGGMIILVSLLLLIIALISMRFTVLSTIEDEIREIGTLKAIGLNNRDIKGLYSAKYFMLTGIACFVAAIGAHGVSFVFLENVSLNFGLSQTSTMTYVMPVVTVLVLYFIVMRSLRKILKRVLKMTVRDALIEGKHVKGKHRKVAQLYWTDKNPLGALSYHQFKSNFKTWSVLTLVFCLSAFAILLPLNLYMTMRSPSFIQYVGAAKSDVRIAIELDEAFKNQNETSIAGIENQLEKDPVVNEWHLFKTIKGSIDSLEGKRAFLMESGDYSEFSVSMDSGRLPSGPGEIALSALNMSRLELELGQALDLVIDDKREVFEVVGVYQDITHGGLTAKIAERASDSMTQFTYFVNFSDSADALKRETFIEQMGATYPRARVISVEELTRQTLGTITASLFLAVMGIGILVFVILALISVLFMRLRMHRQWTEDAGLLAVGFKVTDLRKLYLYQGGTAIVIGVMLGALASVTLGAGVINGFLMAMRFGLTKMAFLLNPWQFLVIGCFLPIAVGMLLVWFVTQQVAHIRVASLGNI